MPDVIVTPCQPRPFPKRWAGLFEARIGDRLLCTSRQPLLDAARALVAEGLDPDAAITMRHAGSATVAMNATLGTAARLTVDESRTRLVRWKAYGPVEGTRIIDETAEGLPG